MCLNLLMCTSPLLITHPTSQVWHIKMMIRQHEYCTGAPQAATLKGHSEMCNFSLLGVREPVSTWCDLHLRHISFT